MRKLTFRFWIPAVSLFIGVLLYAQSPAPTLPQPDPKVDTAKQIADLKAENENLRRQIDDNRQQYNTCAGSLGNAVVQIQILSMRQPKRTP